MNTQHFVVEETGDGCASSPVMYLTERCSEGDLLDTEIVVETLYCALNHPDKLMTRAGYQLRPRPPFTLGSELVGRVVRAGARVQEREGRLVAALTWHGAFSTHVRLDAGEFESRPNAMVDVRSSVGPRTLLRAPLYWLEDGDDPLQIAALGFAYSSALHALKDRAALQPGETLLVLGPTGGLGLAATQIGKALGAVVIAATRPEDDDALCAPWADELVTCDEVLRREKGKPKRYDVVFDVLGGDYTEAALRTLEPFGRLLVIGFLAGVPDLPTNQVLLRECSILGTAWGSWASREPEQHVENFAQLVSWLRTGEVLRPHIVVRPFSEILAVLEGRADTVSGSKLVFDMRM